MLNKETRTLARHLFYAEHWKIGTIARELQIHPVAVRHAIEANRFHGARARTLRATITDPYLPCIRQILDQHPRLRATRIHHLLVERGYSGSVTQLRRVVATLRPSCREPFLRLQTFPGEQCQVDWADFGEFTVGRARRLSGFIALLLYSQNIYVEFFFEQGLENLLRALARAFEHWNGVPRSVVEDNLGSVVLEQYGTQIVFHPRLLELCAHYHCNVSGPYQVRAREQKGRVDRAIRFLRESYWAASSFSTQPRSAPDYPNLRSDVPLEECNRQVWQWCEQVANRRPWPGGDQLTVAEAFAQEQPRLLPLPAHPFND